MDFLRSHLFKNEPQISCPFLSSKLDSPVIKTLERHSLNVKKFKGGKFHAYVSWTYSKTKDFQACYSIKTVIVQLHAVKNQKSTIYVRFLQKFNNF